MDELIRSKMHEALDVELPAGDLRSRVINSLPVGEPRTRRFRTPSFRWAAEFVAIFLAVVVAAGLLYSRSSVVPTGSATPSMVSPPAGPFVPVSMMTATDGWADPHLERAPQAHNGRRGALDRRLAAVGVRGRGEQVLFPRCFTRLDRGCKLDATPSVHRSPDHRRRRTWQQASQITLDVVSASALDANPQGGLTLDFLDSEHGWLFIAAILQPQSPASESHFDALFRTGDGGLHWTLVSTNSWSFIGAPFVSGCPWGSSVFTSLTTGFMISPDRTYELGKTQNCPTPNRPSLHVTNDGGLTWHFQALSVTGPSLTCTSLFICVLDAPRFVDRLHGFLMLGGTTLLATSDGGGSWSLRSMPGSLSDATSIGWLDARIGWAWTYNGSLIPTPATDTTPMTALVPLYRTSDGGATWARVQTNLRYQTADGSVKDIYFVDDKVGFAVRYTEAAGYTWLIRTTDGGLTWTEVGRLR